MRRTHLPESIADRGVVVASPSVRAKCRDGREAAVARLVLRTGDTVAGAVKSETGAGGEAEMLDDGEIVQPAPGEADGKKL